MEKLWMLHPWDSSRLDGMGLYPPGYVGGVPAHGRGLELGEL